MPGWIISSTTNFDLSVYRNIRTGMSNKDDQIADKFYAVIGTANDYEAGILLTDPAVVTTGESSEGKGSLDGWSNRTVSLPIADGINLEDFVGAELYLHLYNNSSKMSACSGGSCKTDFYFDDATLKTCTTEPLPETITTRITGKLTLHFSDGSTENPERVKIWAYAPNGEVYETLTIQGGEFNFYNLPATQEGIDYILYAQYYLVQYAGEEIQIETLANDIPVRLTTDHTDSDPFQTFLDLYTLDPLPVE
jgi:hypothetical protein